jgi:hypothetical protein
MAAAPTYYFDEGTKRWMPHRVRVTGELELDMPWTDRPLIRAKMFREELVRKRPEAEARHVIDYARIGEAMTFATKDPAAQNGRGPDIVLEKGAIVEVMAPSPFDQGDIDKKREEGIQLVSIYWRGRTRLVHASMLFRSSEAAFRHQQAEEGSET